MKPDGGEEGMNRTFRDRAEAGRLLAVELRSRIDPLSAVILALPRGGVPVAFEIAQALGAPLDVFVVRKVGVPGHQELAMGAVAGGGVLVLNREVLDDLGIPDSVVAREAERQRRLLQELERRYRGDRPAREVQGKQVVLVDDGLATGSTMRAAVQALRSKGPSVLLVAVPVGKREVCDRVGREADGIICLARPESFYAVSLWYDDFAQVSDEEVRELLAQASQGESSGTGGAGSEETTS